MEFLKSLIEFTTKHGSCISIYYSDRYQIKSIWVNDQKKVKRYIKQLMIIIKTHVINPKFTINIQEYTRSSTCSFKVDFDLKTEPRALVQALKFEKHRNEYELKTNYPEIIIGKNNFYL